MKWICGLVAALLSLPVLSLAEEVPVQGRHCLSVGRDRSVEEARLLVHSLAIRKALEETGVLDEASVSGSWMRADDLVQVILSAHVKDVRVLEHEETDETLCETVEIRVDPDALREAVRREVQSRAEGMEERGLGNNGCLKLLAVQEDEDRYGRRVEAVARVLKNTGALNSSEQRRRKPCFKVCIDFMGPGGVPVGGDARFIDESAEGTVAGEMRSLSFYVPKEARSYRVWLPGETERASQPGRPAPASAVAKEAAAPETDGPVRPIEDVKAVDGPGGLRIDVISDGPIERHRHFFMEDPPRLVIDLPGLWKQPRFHARKLDGSPVERIRIGHHPGKLRLVLDLRESGRGVSAMIRETPEGLSVDMEPR